MKKKLSFLMVAFMAVAAFAVQNSWRAEGDEWTIAGSADVLGSSWNISDESNNMTVGEDGFTYTLIKENVTLGKGTYEYKVVKNHSWNNENYGAEGKLGGDNCKLEIAEDGVYNVTFTFVNDDSHALSAKAEKTGSAVVEKTYTVAGSPATLFGTAWDPTNTANDMTLADGVYTWSKSDVELAAGDVEFKVVVNHSWDVSYGQNGGGSNYVLKIEEAGIYTVAITFDAETNVPAAVATKTGDIVEPTYIYAVVGGKKVAEGEEADAAIFSGNWDAAGTTDLMTLDEESGKYVWKKEAAKLDPQTIALKVIKKVEGAEEATAWYPTNDVEIEIAEAGEYNVTVTFDPNAEDLWAQNTVTAVAEKVVEPIVINSMAIVGDLTGGWPVENAETGEWDWSMALQLQQDAENANIWSATVEGVDIEAKQYFYKAAANNSWDGYQLPAEGNADFVFGTDEYPAGKYNLTFTVDTEKNELTLVPEKQAEFIEVATIPGNEALVAGKLLVIEAADEANANVIVKAGETEIQDIMADGLVFFELTNDAFTTGEFKVLADNQINVTKAYVAESAEGSWTQIWPAPVVISSMAIVGDFLGLEATEEDANPNWTPANGWAMVQDAENPAVWTLTKRFVAEAKNYEYKATANGNWDDYVLPNGDNANYNFDTADLGAGKYILTFTANTEEHTITLAAEKVVPVVFPENAVVFDFEAAAAAGENPANKNGSAANGQAFYAWEKADKTDSKRQDYKGYEWAEGSVLPEVCQVWRRSDRINGNVKDEGLYCPNNREFAVDGLEAGSKVIVVYDAIDATDKELVWAVGDGTSEGGPGAARATATINGVEAVIGETTIASGAEIVVNSVTPAENGTGYIVFQVKKGMYIKQIAVVPAEPQPNYYLVGNMNDRTVSEDYKLARNENAQGEEYLIKVNLTAESQFKVVKADGENLTWYPEGENNNYGQNGEITTPGEYIVYFRPNADGGEDWFYGVIYAQNPAVGINLVNADDLNNAVIYNLNGQRVMNAQKGMYIVNGRKVVIK